MLEGLDDLAWGGLLHAYGSADDLPGLIRAAASADEAEADGAVEGLFSSLFHQGTVYPASAAVVPFVAELAAELGGHARPLLPLLRAALDDRWARVDAARALWRLGGDAGDLVEPLVAAAAECYGAGVRRGPQRWSTSAWGRPARTA